MRTMGSLDEDAIAKECRASDYAYEDVPDATAPTVNMRDLYYARLNRWPLQHAQAGAVVDIPQKAGLGLDAAGVGMMVRTHKLKRADMPPPSMELQDIVKICNQAARHQLGGLVWLCYESCGASSKTRVKARKCSPAHGAMCIAVTAKTARKMQRDWKKLGFTILILPCGICWKRTPRLPWIGRQALCTRRLAAMPHMSVDANQALGTGPRIGRHGMFRRARGTCHS